jgi:ABC-type transport system involved in multi-copper enzyme maturation permease subunit
MKPEPNLPFWSVVSITAALGAGALFVGAFPNDFRYLVSFPRWSAACALFGFAVAIFSLQKEERPVFLAIISLLMNLIIGGVSIALVLITLRSQ